MRELTELQTRILPALEEAGEDDLSALVNTVGGGHGAGEEIRAVSSALSGLIEGGMLEIARFRNKDTLRWTPLPMEESLALLSNLESFMRWSASERLWRWHSDIPRAEVLLTDAGIAAARRILAEQGWRQRSSP